MGNSRRRGRDHSWWHESTNGVKNWIGVVIVAALAVVAVGTAAVAFQPPKVTAAASEYTPAPAPQANRKEVTLFIGDSYSAGTGATAKTNRWTARVAQDLDWSEFNQALGGTGYITTSSTQGCGLEYCGTYAEAVAGVSENARPTIVVISGGRNDDEGLPADTVKQTIRSAQERWPEARVVVTSPLWDDDEMPNWMEDVVTTVRDAAAATGVTYLDLGQPLYDRPDLVSDDSTHPNDEGHLAISQAFEQAYAQAFPPAA